MRLDPDRLFRGLDPAPGRGVIVAVSGGSDSLSLLLLAKAYADARMPQLPLQAVTVDHGLRPESADEARMVAAFCAARGIAHRTMIWRGDKPATGISVAARDARYGLLAEAAREFGADCMLTGHTMDDQAETVAMRARRGAGSGLSGMARATLFDERVWIVRPLLDVRRAALRDWLTMQGVCWIDDPSNANEAYERVRMRGALEDATVERLAAQAGEAGVERRKLSEACATLLDGHVFLPAPGLFRIDRRLFEHRSAAAVQALRVVLGCAGGATYLPDTARIDALFSKIAAGRARVSLSRTVVDARKDAVWVLREARGLPDPAPLAGETIWDGRWRISAGAGKIAALGAERATDHDFLSFDAPPALVRAALSAEPALYREGACPGLADGQTGVCARRLAGPFAHYLPDFDLATARAMMRLISDSAPPPSPWKHHIGS